MMTKKRLPPPSIVAHRRLFSPLSDVEIDSERLVSILGAPGKTLKRSRKSETQRVGEWVVKRSLFDRGRGPLKHTFLRERQRRVAVAAMVLPGRGVSIPKPLAYVETVRWGVIWRSEYVSEFLEGAVNVEEFARGIERDLKDQKDVRDQRIDEFLGRLAETVNSLETAKVYHGDLSGKNILTRDGEQFYFIDLDAVQVDRPYTDDLRLKNHVQLYDSFCDLWADERLELFIEKLNPPDRSTWFNEIREGQQVRRARIEQIWAKEKG